MTIILMGVMFIVGSLIGMGVATPSNQAILDKFVDPVCVSQKVGADFIQKCYTIKEVSEL